MILLDERYDVFPDREHRIRREIENAECGRIYFSIEYHIPEKFLILLKKFRNINHNIFIFIIYLIFSLLFSSNERIYRNFFNQYRSLS